MHTMYHNAFLFYIVVTINPVSFCAEPNSNNSIYVHWNETSHTANPLLLRYDIKVYGPLHSNGSITIVDHTLLLSDKREKVISGLRSNALYEIVMTASSDDIESTKTEMTVKTYPSGKYNYIHKGLKKPVNIHN